jgi:FkbM family methyltransferase
MSDTQSFVLEIDDSWQLQEFRQGPRSISYPKEYYAFVTESLIFDVYRSDLLREDDIVMDLGASTGEFTILASEKIGSNGLVIAVEPNPKSYKLLLKNLSRNGCRNVISINKGVAAKNTLEKLSFWGTDFDTELVPLENIVQETGLSKKIDFFKIDIEGYETDVIHRDIDIIKKAEIISAELHNTKSDIDPILISHGFEFLPLTKYYCFKKLVQNTLMSRPSNFLKVIANTVIKDPRAFSAKPEFFTGSYIRNDSRRRMNI